ncbi:MAG: endosialidase [Eubacterium sp.]|nr:endosialidase [Eubacterium sp.]
MSVVEELIREESDGSLSFGNYELDAKTKKADFPYDGASYKIKTFREITKLERNGTMVYESVPGSAVTNFKGDKTNLSFDVEAPGDLSFTIELEPDTVYRMDVDGESVGSIKTNLGGKLNASIELDAGKKASVTISKL